MGQTVCRNEECVRSPQCQRFKNAEGEEILFVNICGDWNEYRWFWEEWIVEDKDEEVKEVEESNSNSLEEVSDENNITQEEK